MTNKEILQANLLDIIFEHRNKNYGAYALRKTYPQRMQFALGIGLGLALLLLMINFLGKKNGDSNGPIDKGAIQLIEINPDKQKPPETPKPIEKTPTAAIKDVTMRIVPDNLADKSIPTISEIDSAAISDHTIKGKFSQEPLTDTVSTVTNNSSTQSEPIPEFSQHEAEFPGGKDAFAKFLQTRLETPDELEAGQQQKVLTRFKVDADGNISDIQIMQSGGDKFDKEVIRVLKKMPKWIPAEQNGVKVPVYFTQTVTFVGIEQ